MERLNSKDKVEYKGWTRLNDTEGILDSVVRWAVADVENRDLNRLDSFEYIKKSQAFPFKKDGLLQKKKQINLIYTENNNVCTAVDAWKKGVYTFCVDKQGCLSFWRGTWHDLGIWPPVYPTPHDTEPL